MIKYAQSITLDGQNSLKNLLIFSEDEKLISQQKENIFLYSRADFRKEDNIKKNERSQEYRVPDKQKPK